MLWFRHSTAPSHMALLKEVRGIVITLHPIRQSKCLIHLELNSRIANVIALVRSLHIFINFFPYILPYIHSKALRNLHGSLAISGSSDKAISASIHQSGRSSKATHSRRLWFLTGLELTLSRIPR